MSSTISVSRNRGRFTRDAGFTLIEVLIAMTVLAVGILAVGTMQTTAINGNASARKHTGASIALSDQVEKLMALPYNDDQLKVAGNPHAGAEPLNPGYVTYDTEWTVTDKPDFKEVRVTVSWVDRGDPRTKTITFLKPE